VEVSTHKAKYARGGDEGLARAAVCGKRLMKGGGDCGGRGEEK